MGQKINPKNFRIGPLYTWDSRWFADEKNYRKFLLEDVKIRLALLEKLKPAGITLVEIERSINKMDITLHVARPGVVIGRGGQGMDEIKKFIQAIIAKYRKIGTKSILKLDIKVKPVKEPNLNAYFMASQIADQLAKRMSHKRVIKQSLERVMTAGARGVKILLAGRIGGAEISRREKYTVGTIPLSTIRENIEYAEIPSLTKSGYIGVKVWICK
ncbi:30S ribosomal protein S3 [Candidatus Gottesmanbacteria bacterium RIFCSPHIGHO2_01_FULL_39_10]|uniref:Small ribosomal subunit protein uS3 n=1 Tax=Candidatus Gottesmanbacteria bacterium RIFCSPHIGHO2_01_FULL_39_10 TaxID=1798375 RepID=A0A1F5ZRD3_9BACT|nr:MAG: 30S ribosomal protein S3 [Candidatus Gottesmanbacteria bacterium RIFCSPHIGHO2_01_FULL_39_10]